MKHTVKIFAILLATALLLAACNRAPVPPVIDETDAAETTGAADTTGMPDTTGVPGAAKKEVKSVILSRNSVAMTIGQKVKIIATFRPEDASLYTDLTWKSFDERIATVDRSGMIKAVSAGSTPVSATAGNGRMAFVQVTVRAPITPETTKAPAVTTRVPETTAPDDGTVTKHLQNSVIYDYADSYYEKPVRGVEEPFYRIGETLIGVRGFPEIILPVNGQYLKRIDLVEQIIYDSEFVLTYAPSVTKRADAFPFAETKNSLSPKSVLSFSDRCVIQVTHISGPPARSVIDLEDGQWLSSWYERGDFGIHTVDESFSPIYKSEDGRTILYSDVERCGYYPEFSSFSIRKATLDENLRYIETLEIISGFGTGTCSSHDLGLYFNGQYGFAYLNIGTYTDENGGTTDYYCFLATQDYGETWVSLDPKKEGLPELVLTREDDTIPTFENNFATHFTLKEAEQWENPGILSEDGELLIGSRLETDPDDLPAGILEPFYRIDENTVGIRGFDNARLSVNGVYVNAKETPLPDEDGVFSPPEYRAFALTERPSHSYPYSGSTFLTNFKKGLMLNFSEKCQILFSVIGSRRAQIELRDANNPQHYVKFDTPGKINDINCGFGLLSKSEDGKEVYILNILTPKHSWEYRGRSYDFTSIVNAFRVTLSDDLSEVVKVETLLSLRPGRLDDLNINGQYAYFSACTMTMKENGETTDYYTFFGTADGGKTWVCYDPQTPDTPELTAVRPGKEWAKDLNW